LAYKQLRHSHYNTLAPSLDFYPHSLTAERDVPVFSNDDTGIITNEDDIIVYQGNNSSFNLSQGRQKIKVEKSCMI
jgi:hypothetical protein